MAANPDHDSVEVLLGELRRDTQIPLELANVRGNHATLLATLRGGDIVPEALVKACHQSPGRARFLKRASTLYVGVFLSQRTLIIGKENVSGVEDCARIANLVTLSLDKHQQILRREQQQQASESLAGHTTALYEQFHTIVRFSRELVPERPIWDVLNSLTQLIPESLNASNAFLVERPEKSDADFCIWASTAKDLLFSQDELPVLLKRLENSGKHLVLCERNPGTQGNGGYVLAARAQPHFGTRLWIIVLRNGPATGFGSEEALFLEAIVGLLEKYLHIVRLYEEKDKLRLTFVESLNRLLKFDEGDFTNHRARVAAIAPLLGNALNLTPEELAHLKNTGLLHDIAKTSLRDSPRWYDHRAFVADAPLTRTFKEDRQPCPAI